jgi:hypothetical protein
MNKNVYILAGVAAAGLGLGGIGGYILASHRLQRRLDREVADVKAYYRPRAEGLLRPDSFGFIRAATTVGTSEYSLERDDSGGGVPGPSGGVEEGGVVGSDGDPEEDRRPHFTEHYQYPGDVGPIEGDDEDEYEPGAARSFGSNGTPDDIEDPDDDEADGSVDDSDDENGYAAGDFGESDPRGPGPYAISESEFFEEHNRDYQKLSITYYRGDNVLCDDKDAPIRDLRATVGQDIANRFGQGDKEPFVVYVRNDKLTADFEVTLNYGAWREIVLGYGSANPKPPHVLPGGV